MNYPWQNFTLSPMGICEEPILNAWVRAPANTWSNIPFILIGIYILLTQRKQLRQIPLLLTIPLSVIIIGLCSLIYHASYSLELLYLDNASMFLLSAFMVSTNLKRLKAIRSQTYWILYCLLVLIPIILMLSLSGASGSVLFILIYLIALVMEWQIHAKVQDVTSYRHFFLMLGIQVFGGVFWLLDQQGIMCDPQNHWFQGHIFWHCANAVSIYFLYRHYESAIINKK